MKKKLLLAFLLITILASCKKEKKAPATAASFTITKSNYYLTEPVSFSNSSTNAATYQWDFGDGQTASTQSPQHAYTTAGTYQVKLTANGSSTAVKSVKIYTGTASYEVDNSSSYALPLVSFATDASNNIIDFKDHGTVASKGKSDTVFTINTSINLGGYIGAKTFIVTTPYPITKYTHNKLALLDTSPIYVGSSISMPTVQNLLHTKSNKQLLKDLAE